ncbi:MAG TPA: tRNA uridine-5-carboxymethylaminomethyl(34) synthesis GTPase MnmE, partial [Legionellales bacterium]|nr:tRNA uridine-5-carboxymethylaminomethyl(34) synthesis GTPase MnmE [Legionellales bacterium]
MTEDTIVALATPPGRGGIGIVRLSGPLAYQIGLKLSQKTQIAARQIVYTSFKDDQGESLDKGIMLFFKAPLSLTGEDIVELQAHGAPVVLDRLVKACLAEGAKLAKPGEFLQRAFLNNKIDLAQAEAVADLIQASSVSAARLALRSVEGEFSQAVSELNRKIIQLRTYVEAAIDFPDEEIDFLNDGMVAQKVTHLITQLATLRAQAKQGSIMREGLSVVIAGEPNAGKSTLINCLANKDVAIVTEIPGTTRDVMREHIMMDDLPLFLVDTAGLRESVDVVEQEGIKRAL